MIYFKLRAILIRRRLGEMKSKDSIKYLKNSENKYLLNINMHTGHRRLSIGTLRPQLS